MRKGTGMLGLPVITLDCAAKVGAVRDLVLDPGRRRVVALLVGSKGGGPLRRVAFESVRRVGPDAVLIESDQSAVPVQEPPGPMTLVEGPCKLSGLQLFTDSGRSAGRVVDIVLDEQSGAVERYEISTGRLRDLVSGRLDVPADLPLAVGTDAMIVPESALSGQPSSLEDGPPVVLEPPSREFAGAPAESPELLAAALVARQEDLIVGRRSEKTIDNEDAGGTIVFEGEPITREIVQLAKEAGKLNLLVEASGEAASAALSGGLTESYADVAAGRMAGCTVRTPDGEVVVSQGDVVTPRMVDRAREAGVMDQLVEAVRANPEETASRETTRRSAARNLWGRVSGRAGRASGRG